MRTAIVFFGFLFLSGAFTDAAAQACLGLPTTPGRLAVQGFVDSGETDTGYGGRGTVYLPWRAALGISYRRDEYELIDTAGDTFGGTIAVELPFTATSICLLTEPSYSTFDYPEGFGLPPARVGTLRLPALVGAGQRLDFASFFVVPSARGGLVHFRTTAEPVTGVTTEESSTEAVIDAGVSIGSGNAFANVGFNILSGQTTRPRFLVALGYMLP